jgi:hypothetical protein
LIANWQKQHVARDGHVEAPWERLQSCNQERENAALMAKAARAA